MIHHKHSHLSHIHKQSQQTSFDITPYNAIMSGQEIPSGDFQDNEYQSRTGQSEVPVQSDDKGVEDPIDPSTADSDAQLGMSFLQPLSFSLTNNDCRA